MPTSPIFFAFCAVLALLGADTGELDPAEYLGAIDDGPGGLSAVHYCPGPTDAVQTPPGPRLDPSDPYALHTLTLNSDPTDPGQICSLSCLHKSTRCYVSSSRDCKNRHSLPARFPSGTRGQPSSLYVCVGATTASSIPLVETVTITTTNDPDTPIWYVVRGSR